MRISYKIWLVGGVPIAIAAAIAVVSWLLLKEAERARDGAVLAGSIYRNLLVAMTARDDYVQALPGERAEHAVRFGALAEQTRGDIATLAGVTRDAAHREASAAAGDSLSRYEQRMRQFMVITTNNDHLAAEMRARIASLIDLTDRARQRQRASNTDIVKSLTEKDRKLRISRDVVEKSQDLRAQIAGVALQELQRNAGTSWDAISAADWKLTLGLAQLHRIATDLGRLLRANAQAPTADELLALVNRYEQLVAGPGDPTKAEPNEREERGRAGQELSDWADKLLKVHASEARSLHEEVAQLLTYSVQANETEQSTQNIAIETLKLGQRTAEALAKRDPNVAAAILGDSQELAATVDRLPISPLIQTEMIEAIQQWRARLTTAIRGLRTQNDMIADMDVTAGEMVDSARSLNDMFISEAQRIGDFILSVLLFGAGVGLLIGSITALAVARSITRPLMRLQQDMRARASDPLAGPIGQSQRRDELGDMAQAANFFVTEIGSREQALREAKEQADRALAELRRTQADLIQAEKLASLGQLVAGVAHEINTPVGIALTTATTLSEEVKNFGELAAHGPIPRSRFVHFIERMREGSELVFSNLTRAGELVHSFKQVAADQVSSERRSFRMSTWVHELLTSLRPVLRKSGHEVALECDPDLVVDTYPGPLAQVLTNLFMNALAHAYPAGASGRLSLEITAARPGELRIVFSDEGSGIAKEHLAKVFDPFFTTARSRGNTGLGLHIVYNLVTSKLQGKIDVVSQVGIGTRFVIVLPTTVVEAVPEKLLASA